MTLEERLNKIENFVMEKKRKEEEAKLDLMREKYNAQKFVDDNIKLIDELCVIVEKIDEEGLLDDNFKNVFFANMLSHKVGFYDLHARTHYGILTYGDYIHSAQIYPRNKTKYTIAMLGGGCCHYDVLVMNGCLGLYGSDALKAFERDFEKGLFELRDRLYEFVDNLGGKN